MVTVADCYRSVVGWVAAAAHSPSGPTGSTVMPLGRRCAGAARVELDLDHAISAFHGTAASISVMSFWRLVCLLAVVCPESENSSCFPPISRQLIMSQIRALGAQAHSSVSEVWLGESD